jgi:hypothetical protein
MSEVMLHGVLNMPADLWDTTSPFDSMQRQSRYFEASKLIYSQADKIAELEKEHNTLTEFADWALDAIFTGSDICGDDAQDKMFELGMLTREIYDPEVHTLSQGSECDAGDYIYFKALKEGK